MDSEDVDDANAKEKSGPNYELLLQEIEGVDDYWGPTFRAIYECEDPTKFMNQLKMRIKQHDKEIERICNNYYQGFIDSVKDLQLVRNRAKQLHKKVLEIDKSIQESSKRFEGKCEQLVEAHRIESNISAAISTLTTCIPVFTTYSKLQKQISDKRYYPALKTLEQLEHLYLPSVSNLRFFQQMKENIPQIRENIKHVSMSDLKDFLENIRRLSSKIGQVAMKHTLEQLSTDPEIISVKSGKKKRHAPPPPNPFTGVVEMKKGEESEEEDVSAQHLIDFSPVYRCQHIYAVLGANDAFEQFYRTERTKQAGLVVQPLGQMGESIENYRRYLQNVAGFFVAEDHVLNTSNGLINDVYLQDLWSVSLRSIISTLKTHIGYCTDADLMLKIKDLILLFSTTLRNYGYAVENLKQLLFDIRDHYNEILIQRWVQVFQEILNGETFEPLIAADAREYDAVLETFPFRDDVLEASPFPRKFPFSGTVPKVYRQVKEFIYASFKFSEDLLISQSEMDTAIRKSAHLLVTRSFNGCLLALMEKTHIAVSSVVQIIADTRYLEEASVPLEEFLRNISGTTATAIATTGEMNERRLFQAPWDDLEKQVRHKLKKKIDEFLELENYDWTLSEPKGHASTFIQDLIAFLRNVFESFGNLPKEIAIKTCHAACEHISKSMLAFMTNESVKQISVGALQQINLDTIQCEQFAASEPIEGVQDSLLQYFNDLRQLLDLLMSWDWSTYFHDFEQENSKYQHVNPITAIIILEKLKEADKKSVFSALKKSERDKKKLLDTVLKQLRQLANIN